uniref:INSM transcriptional repressor 2 n=1 Tax=Hucho hucho TaxID=62062 RepID=A0A4W5MQT8_9TELE
MPRGFLVKRSKRGSAASYRTRNDDNFMPKADLPEWPTGLPESADKVEIREDFGKYPPHHPRTEPDNDGSPGRADLSYSPIKPVGAELEKSSLDRCISSPTVTDPYAMSTPVSSIERLLLNHAPFGHSDMKFDPPVHLYQSFHHAMKRTYMEQERKIKPAAKKPKVIRKLSFEDEISTSPVLGLRIKKETPEFKAATASSAYKKPLGEFICQLCKEEYPDPFSLAQHKCSRIVRVEYRCPECDKVFSCPANLASHRRWHKPRPQRAAAQEGTGEPTALRSTTDVALPNSSFLKTSGTVEEIYECHYCSKKFRRQAYLRKHLAAHETIKDSTYNQLESGQITFPCHLCGAHFPSTEIWDKHRVWHAMRDDILMNPGKNASSLYFMILSRIGQYPDFHIIILFFSNPGIYGIIGLIHNGALKRQKKSPLGIITRMLTKLAQVIANFHRDC